MENEKDLKYSWSLVFSCPPYFSPVRLPGEKFIYRTEKIENPTTAREIWKSSESFLKEIVEKYNNHQTPGEKTILATYTLSISWKEEPNTKPTKEKNIYSSIWKIEENRKIKIEEKKKYRASETIEPNFYIFLVPTVYIFRERAHNPEENEHEEKKNILKLSKCCICLKNRPNILFRRCWHRVICEECDKSTDCKFCPLCKNSLVGTRKHIFIRGKYYYTTATVTNAQLSNIPQILDIEKIDL